MKKTTIAMSAAISFLLGLPLAFAQSSLSRLGSSMSNLPGRTLEWFNTFVTSGYQSYPKAIDFTVFFFLFFAATLIGLRKWMGEKENARTTTGLALVLSLAFSFALVFATKFTLLKLAPFAKGFIFLILVLLVYAMLLKAGMEKHKIAAFLLALLFTFLMFWLFGALTDDQFGSLSFSQQIGSLFAGEGGSSSGGSGGDNGGTGGALAGSYETCKTTLTDAFPKDAESLSRTGEFDQFLSLCTGQVRGTTYASKEEDEGIASKRASGLMSHINSMGKTGSILGGGSTWQFAADPGKEAPASEREKAYSKNRAVMAECRCKKTGEGGSNIIDNLQATTCKELLDKNILNQLYDAIKGVEGTVEGTKKIEDEETLLRNTLAQCEKEYKKLGTGSAKERYFDAVEKVMGAIGRTQFRNSDYDKARDSFQYIADRTGRTNKALQEYYNMLLERYTEDLATIKGYGNSGDFSSHSNKVKLLANFRDDEVNKTIAAMNKGEFRTYQDYTKRWKDSR